MLEIFNHVDRKGLMSHMKEQAALEPKLDFFTKSQGELSTQACIATVVGIACREHVMKQHGIQDFNALDPNLKKQYEDEIDAKARGIISEGMKKIRSERGFLASLEKMPTDERAFYLAQWMMMRDARERPAGVELAKTPYNERDKGFEDFMVHHLVNRGKAFTLDEEQKEILEKKLREYADNCRFNTNAAGNKTQVSDDRFVRMYADLYHEFDNVLKQVLKPENKGKNKATKAFGWIKGKLITVDAETFEKNLDKELEELLSKEKKIIDAHNNSKETAYYNEATKQTLKEFRKDTRDMKKEEFFKSPQYGMAATTIGYTLGFGLGLGLMAIPGGQIPGVIILVITAYFGPQIGSMLLQLGYAIKDFVGEKIENRKIDRATAGELKTMVEKELNENKRDARVFSKTPEGPEEKSKDTAPTNNILSQASAATVDSPPNKTLAQAEVAAGSKPISDELKQEAKDTVNDATNKASKREKLENYAAGEKKQSPTQNIISF